MATTTPLLTAEDLLRIPNDGYRYELVRGELRKMSPPGIRHAQIVGNLAQALGVFVKANRLGIMLAGDPGFTLARNPDIVLAPDVGFVRADRLTAGVPVGFWQGAPDLAVEVISPGDTVHEVEEKVADWLTLGCRMVVIVSDKKRTVTVHRPGQSPRFLSGNEILDGEDVVPGFRLPLTDIFA